MQNPAFQVHTQPQSTPGTALEIPAGKPKVGQGQALSTSPPPTTPATPRQCPCTLHLRSIVWVFHLATLRSQHAQDQTMPSKSWHGTLSWPGASTEGPPHKAQPQLPSAWASPHLPCPPWHRWDAHIPLVPQGAAAAALRTATSRHLWSGSSRQGRETQPHPTPLTAVKPLSKMAATHHGCPTRWPPPPPQAADGPHATGPTRLPRWGRRLPTPPWPGPAGCREAETSPRGAMLYSQGWRRKGRELRGWGGRGEGRAFAGGWPGRARLGSTSTRWRFSRRSFCRGPCDPSGIAGRAAPALPAPPPAFPPLPCPGRPPHAPHPYCPAGLPASSGWRPSGLCSVPAGREQGKLTDRGLVPHNHRGRGMLQGANIPCGVPSHFPASPGALSSEPMLCPSSELHWSWGICGYSRSHSLLPTPVQLSWLDGERHTCSGITGKELLTNRHELAVKCLAACTN